MIWLKNCLLDVKQQSLIHSLIHPKINRKRQNYGKKKGGGEYVVAKTIHNSQIFSWKWAPHVKIKNRKWVEVIRKGIEEIRKYLTQKTENEKHVSKLKTWSGWFMMFNATFNSISVVSWRSVLYVEETEGPGENHRPVASHWQTHNFNSDVRNWLHR